MGFELDSVQLGVTDLDSSRSDYEVLFGVAPVLVGRERVRFQLAHGGIELEIGAPAVQSLRFVTSNSNDLTSWPQGAAAFHGLTVFTGMQEGTLRHVVAPRDGVESIDHVVIQSPDLQRARTLWSDQLGIRLALDREFPARGLRMLFFRSAGMTLEFVGALHPRGETTGPDALYGLAYTVADLAACRDRLRAGGVDVSEIRPGQKRGTIVATVRSRTAGVPTLLIQDKAGP